MPWLWDLIDVLNSFLFTVRYGRRLRLISSEGIIIKGLPSKFKIVPIREIPTEQLVAFFAHQPEEAFEFFKPHGFDAKSIKSYKGIRHSLHMFSWMVIRFLVIVLIDHFSMVRDSVVVWWI